MLIVYDNYYLSLEISEWFMNSWIQAEYSVNHTFRTSIKYLTKERRKLRYRERSNFSVGPLDQSSRLQRAELFRKTVLYARSLYFSASSAISSLYFRWSPSLRVPRKLKERLRVRDTRNTEIFSVPAPFRRSTRPDAFRVTVPDQRICGMRNG